MFKYGHVLIHHKKHDLQIPWRIQLPHLQINNSLMSKSHYNNGTKNKHLKYNIYNLLELWKKLYEVKHFLWCQQTPRLYIYEYNAFIKRNVSNIIMRTGNKNKTVWIHRVINAPLNLNFEKIKQKKVLPRVLFHINLALGIRNACSRYLWYTNLYICLQYLTIKSQCTVHHALVRIITETKYCIWNISLLQKIFLK